MNAMMARGQYNRFRGGFMMRWGNLTGHPMQRLNGRRLRLLGRAQATLGQARFHARRRLRRLAWFA